MGKTISGPLGEGEGKSMSDQMVLDRVFKVTSPGYIQKIRRNFSLHSFDASSRKFVQPKTPELSRFKTGEDHCSV